MVLTYVRAFGIELEGGWDRRPPIVQSGGASFREDGSVRTNGDEWSGEIPSPVLHSWAEASTFVIDNYPEHVGSTCGMHVHMSFGDRQKEAVSALLDSDGGFLNALVADLKAWGRKKQKVSSQAFYSRLDGENEYANLRWLPNNAIRDYRSDDYETRYTICNFVSLHTHGTVEIRVLPMFRSARLSMRAVRRVIAFTELYLRRARGAGLGNEYETGASFDLAAGTEQPLYPAGV